MARRSGSERDYLAIVSVTITGAFLLCTLLFAVVMGIVQREQLAAERAARPEHVAYQRANETCEKDAPPLATGWTVAWDRDARRFVCLYDRNGRPLGKRDGDS
jgi:hypothetical protein